MAETEKRQRVQIPNLETFSTTAEMSSFTKAAQVLGLTQAAVSQRIQAIERTIDKSLFQRRGGRVQLTEAGQKLYVYAQRILELHREARRDVAKHDVPIVGELFLAACSVPGEYFLPAILSVFGQLHPQIRVHATVNDSMAVIAQVERGEASLGLVGRKSDNHHLSFHFIAKDRMVLVVPPGHPLSRRKKLSVKQLSNHAIILREMGSGLRHCFEKSLAPTGRLLGDLRIALELGSNEAVKEAVLRGVGAAILSSYAVRKELQTGTLIALDVCDLTCERDLFIVQDKRRPLPPPARLFLRFLENHPISGLVP